MDPQDPSSDSIKRKQEYMITQGKDNAWMVDLNQPINHVYIIIKTNTKKDKVEDQDCYKNQPRIAPRTKQ